MIEASAISERSIERRKKHSMSMSIELLKARLLIASEKELNAIKHLATARAQSAKAQAALDDFIAAQKKQQAASAAQQKQQAASAAQQKQQAA